MYTTTMKESDSSRPPPPKDFSDTFTVVEYAVRNMFKKKSPAVAAKMTVKSLAGSSNMFIGGGQYIVQIDPKKLENALYNRMVEYALKYKDVEIGIVGTLHHFEQFGKKRVEKELRARVEKAMR
jgi:hypothetical protein